MFFVLYNSFLHVVLKTYVPIFQGLNACGGRKLQTFTHTHNYNNDNIKIILGAEVRAYVYACNIAQH